MSDPLRLRYPSPIEAYVAYLPFTSWPVIWLLPYGYWTWAIAFAPDLLIKAFQWLHTKRPARAVTSRRSDTGVELVERSGVVVEKLRDADVESVTRLFDASGKTTSLRVDRSEGQALVFETSSEHEVEDVARRLGLALAKARGRYRTGSRAARLGVLLFLGMGALAWSAVAPPTDVQLATGIMLFTRWVTLPLLVLFAIPTWVDVGADGVGWRWLFLRRYVPFSKVEAIEPVMRGERPLMMRLAIKDGSKGKLWLTKESGPLVQHLREAFAAAKQGTSAVDARLARGAAESWLGWVGRLRGMGIAGGGYRGESVDDLWNVAEEPNAPFDARIGAALVLASSDAARERVRAISTRVVSPAGRAAFAAVADGAADERIARLLEPLASEIDAADRSGIKANA